MIYSLEDSILVDFATNYQKPSDGSKSDLIANQPLALVLLIR